MCFSIPYEEHELLDEAEIEEIFQRKFPSYIETYVLLKSTNNYV